MQEALNRADHGLKVSSFPYTEGPRKFGCNAGLLHLYMSASGDVWPCDFIPISFGNALREDIDAIYARMKSQVGVSRRGCWAKLLAKDLSDRKLPLLAEQASDLCRQCPRSPRFGDFFRTLQEGAR